MNNLTSDCIAIDTNVFEHLLTPSKNENEHITKLFNAFIDDGIGLIVDEGGAIEAEYSNRIERRIKEAQDKGYDSIFRYYFVAQTTRKQVRVKHNDELMSKIKSIVGNVPRDHIFIYVAIKKDKVLVTNDRNDILDEGNSRYKRRNKLLSIAKKQQLKSARIYDSQEAYGKL